MDAIAQQILDRLKEQAAGMGADLMQDGMQLLEQYLDGRASDEDIMAWLRQAQEEERP